MKTKKFERVENYIYALMEQNNQSTDHLSQLNYKDLMTQPELEGIGERTVANTLNAFKQKIGIKNVKRNRTKRKRVEDFLDNLISEGRMSVEELMKKKYNDFQDIAELEEIGKTTITCALSDFKKNHESDRFEQSLLSFLQNENEPESSVGSITSDIAAMQSTKSLADNLDNSEVRILKEMIADYKQNFDKEKLALQELQLALRYVGIDCRTLMEQYWNGKRNGIIPAMEIKHQIPDNQGPIFYDVP